MVKDKVAAYVIMETTSEPEIPRNVKVFNKNNLFYLRYNTTLQTFNIKNRNGRIYVGEGMEPSLRADHIIELMRKRSWCGEAGHPDSEDMKRILTIDPKCISHRIVDIDISRNKVDGVLETLDNDGYGNSKTKLILQGMETAYSLRALAPLIKRGDGTSVVKGKSHVVTYDWVILPSHKEAYMDNQKPVEKVITAITAEGNTMVPSREIAVNEAALKDFIIEESKNVKLISSVCEVGLGSMIIGKDAKNIILKENGNTYFIPLEEKIKYDINTYMRNL
jgi:hypothetical protein